MLLDTIESYFQHYDTALPENFCRWVVIGMREFCSENGVSFDPLVLALAVHDLTKNKKMNEFNLDDYENYDVAMENIARDIRKTIAFYYCKD